MESKKSVTDLKAHHEGLHNSQKELATKKKKKAASPAHRKGKLMIDTRKIIYNTDSQGQEDLW